MTAAFDIYAFDQLSVRQIRSVEAGLPIGLLDELADAIAPGDTRFRYRLIPKSTLAKQRGVGRMTAEQGGKVAAIARMWSRARQVWKSDSAARAFLNRPNMLLDDATPLDMALSNTAGARLIEDILGRLEYGTGV